MSKTVRNILLVMLGVILTVGVILVPWQDLADRIGFDPFRTNIPGSLKATCLSGKCKVYVDGQYEGETPVEIVDITPGEHTVKIERVASTSGFYTSIERKPTFLKATQVYMEWEIGPSEIFSQGHVLSFKERNHKTDPVLSITSQQQDVKISIDGVAAGEIPYLGASDDLSEGEHKITLTKTGYVDRELEVTINYKYISQIEVELMAKPIEAE